MKSSFAHSFLCLIAICVVVILSSLANPIPCNSFPKILGGSLGHSIVHQIDVFEDYLAYAGGTGDSSLTTIATNVPFIILSSISINYYYWTKVFTQIQGHDIAGLQFSSDGKYMIAHSNSINYPTTSPGIIVVIDVNSGKIISSRTYSNYGY